MKRMHVIDPEDITCEVNESGDNDMSISSWSATTCGDNDVNYGSNEEIGLPGSDMWIPCYTMSLLKRD